MQYIDAVTEVYELALAQTLGDGYLGTGACPAPPPVTVVVRRTRSVPHVPHVTVPGRVLGHAECCAEENILAMIYARFPQLFAGYDNNMHGLHGDN